MSRFKTTSDKHLRNHANIRRLRGIEKFSNTNKRPCDGVNYYQQYSEMMKKRREDGDSEPKQGE